MAKWLSLGFLIVCAVLLVLVLEVDDSEARGARGGGRFGSRSSYRSARYGSRVRVRQRVRYGGGGYGGSRVRVRQRVRYSSTSRMYKGTYGLSRSTWKAAFLAGTIYGGARYLRSPRYHRYPNRMPTICMNTVESDDNGTIYNKFYCPRFFEPDDYQYCCGDASREYCCKYFDSPGRTAGIVIGVLVVVLIVGIIVYCVCKKTGKSGQIINKFSSSKQQTHYAVPYYAPAPTMGYTPQPVQPPPQPQQQPGYPDPYAGNGKAGLPEADVSQGGTPYPAQPYPTQPYPTQPYPPAPEGMPPPQGGMYPPPQGYPAPQGYTPVGPPPPGEMGPPGMYPPPAGPYPSQPPPAYGQ